MTPCYTIYKLFTASLLPACYVGQSKQATVRLGQHLARGNTKLATAFQQVPPSEWQMETLHVADSLQLANSLEAHYIRIYRCVEIGFNILECNPGSSKRYHAMRHAQKRKGL